MKDPPLLLLFKDGKVWKYNGPKNGETYTVDGLLNFLSADNHIEQGTVWFDDAQDFIDKNLNRSTNKMYEQF